MKKLILVLCSALLFSCSAKKKVVNDYKDQKDTLSEFIVDRIKSGDINKEHLILLNEKKLSEEEVKNLKLSNDQIEKLSVIKKGNSQMIEIYGKGSENGIIMITTKREEQKEMIPFKKSKILYILDGKIVRESVLKILSPNDIESINVIKDKKEVAKYTDKSYDGVIIIKMKKN